MEHGQSGGYGTKTRPIWRNLDYIRGMRSLVLFLGLVIPAVVLAQSAGTDQKRWESEAKQVTILRDKWGIPHVYGKTDAATVFGLLYAECQEDFPRVEKNYLEMLGRQAEAYGESYLYTDVMMRLVYDSAQAVADYNRSPGWMHQLLDAFADGVNYYLFKHPETKPLLLKHFEPWYALMFTDGSVSATSTGGVRLDEIKAFYEHKAPPVSSIEKMVLEDRGITVPEKPAMTDSPAFPKEEEDERGSNGFAISGFRTASEAT